MLLAAWLLVLTIGSVGAADTDAHSDGLTFELRLSRPRAFPQQQLSLTATLLVGDASVRNMGFPRLVSPVGGVAEFGPPRELAVVRGGREQRAYEFLAKVRPAAEGRMAIGPAEIAFDVLSRARGAAAVFGGVESRRVVVQAAPVVLDVIGPPLLGRPPDYAGVIGRVALTREVAPRRVEAGDPITVITRIVGVGGVDTLGCPSLALSGVRLYPVRLQRDGAQVVCEQVLRPETSADVEIPEARITYFDPDAGRYAVVTAPAVRVEVVAAVTGAIPAEAARAERVAPPVADTPADDSTPSSSMRGWGWLAVAMATLAGGIIGHRSLRRRRGPVAEERPAARLDLGEVEAAYSAGDDAAFHTAAFRSLQRWLAGRYGIPPGGISESSIRRAVGPAADESLREACAQVFRAGDRARYSPRHPDSDATAAVRVLLKELAKRR